MRHSFLPNQEQKILKRGYRIRATIVLLFFLSIAGLVGIGSLFPSYIHVYTEERSELEKVASLRENKDTSGLVAIEKELQSDTAKISVLSKISTTVHPSSLIEDMVNTRGQVRLTSIVLSSVSTSTAVIVIQGVAPTRESLVAFKTRLEGLAIGNKVDLPISGFAKSRDIPFSLRVIDTIK